MLNDSLYARIYAWILARNREAEGEYNRHAANQNGLGANLLYHLHVHNGIPWTWKAYMPVIDRTLGRLRTCRTDDDVRAYVEFLYGVVHTSVEDPLNVWSTCSNCCCGGEAAFSRPDLFVNNFINNGGLEWAEGELLPANLRN